MLHVLCESAQSVLLTFMCRHNLMLNTTVTSHYVLFRLGADHDGSNNACTSSDYFIMASVSAAVNNQNPWKFSTCSIDYFTAYINDLNR